MLTRRCFCCAVAAAPSAWSRATTPMGERLRALLAEADEEQLALHPQNAVMRGDLRRAHEFGDLISDDYHRAVHDGLRRRLRGLAGIDRAQLARAERVAYDTLRYQTAHALRGYERGHARIQARLALDHLFGQHIAFAQFSSGRDGAPFETLADYEAGLARLGGFVLWIDRALGRLREGVAAGQVQPRAVTAKVIAQLDAALELAPEASPFLGPIGAFPASIAEAERPRLAAAYRQAHAGRVLPALARLRDYLREAYLPAGRIEVPGLVGLRGGGALYEHLLESHTTVPMRAAAVHRLGLAEVARVRRDMEAVRREVGFGGSLAQFFAHVQTDPAFQFASEDALLAAYRAVGERVQRELPRLFATLPRSALEIRPVPAEQRDSAAGAYYIVGSADGKRPGVFFVNTGALSTRTTPWITAVYLHEALPGHHLQGSLTQEDTALPANLRFGWSTSFIEGWGLYAEWLGYEMGLYADPMQRFGALNMEMLRAARLVVDTGLHALGWSRERAADYLSANSSLARAAVEQEVDRYLAWPGQATAYKIGELRIRALRTRAERALGSRFDLRAFHTQVLDTGALPLAVLEAKLGEWIDKGGQA